MMASPVGLCSRAPLNSAAVIASKNDEIVFKITESEKVIATFKGRMDGRLKPLRTATPAPGQERVLYAGLSDAEEIQHRRAHGIPLHKEVIHWFGVCTGEMGLEPLAAIR
jgi:LDH2 family malate/lactate/ureidoglycolate dehydrogenase